MFRTILVPLDGSVFAEHAVPLAVSLAKQAGAVIRLLRVVPPLADYLFLPPEMNNPLDKQLRSEHRDEALAYLESIVARIKDAVSVVCDVLEEQEGVCETIIADVVKTGADLIVLSSHGRGALERMWLGSNADVLVRTAPVPVLMARPREHPPAADLEHPVALKHILLALSGSTRADDIVAPALALGRLAGADYTVVRIVRPSVPPLVEMAPDQSAPGAPSVVGTTDEQHRQEADDYLRKVADRLRKEGATVQTHVRMGDNIDEAILQEATFVGADMIVLETHGRGASRLLVGSVADKVVRASSIPVLVCRLPSSR